MKKLILFLIIYLFTVNCWGVPSNSISIPNSFSPNTTISSSEMNANFNEGQSKFNAHSHTDITSLGTITTGAWNATVISTTYGGTGQNFGSTAQGSIPYFSASGTMSALDAGTSGQFLKTQGASANPTWATIATNVKIGTFTHNVASTGAEAVTGVGFQPDVVYIFTAFDNSIAGSWGFYDGTTDACIQTGYGGTTAGNMQIQTLKVVYLAWPSSLESYADGTSLDSDGFTLTWNKANSPTGTINLYYLAIKK